MRAASGKARRQRALLETVRARPIASQSELAAALRRRGFDVALSTLSRDLRELRVLRMPVGAGFRYLPAAEAPARGAGRRLQEVAAAEVVAVDANESVVVVRTEVGRAGGVAAFLDARAIPGVLATVAGDDAILVVPASTRRTAALRRALRRLFDL